MSEVGIILVSHSNSLAQGVADLVHEIAENISFTFVGGLPDGGIGTSFDQVQEIIEQNAAQTLLAFFDLGSARMNIDMASEFSTKTILVQQVPVVEGAYTAAALLQAGAPLESILQQLNELQIQK